MARAIGINHVALDVGAPRGAGAGLVDLEHREVGHEARRRRAVPVLLARLEEHAVAGADQFDLPSPPLHEPHAFGDVHGLTVGMRVPGRSRARCEANGGS